MCATVASSPILAVQLAERALTACNYRQNHLLPYPSMLSYAPAPALHSMAHVSVNFGIPGSFAYVSVMYRERPAGMPGWNSGAWPPTSIHSL